MLNGDITQQEFRTLTREAELIENDKPFSVTRNPNNPRIAVIRTSDRILFKTCRRRWGWNSHLRHNLGPKQNASPLWFGSGFHFALEDYHGYNRFNDPIAAFKAYVKATQEHDEKSLPDDWQELTELGEQMLEYYIIWLSKRNLDFKTYWVNGVPQVEVNFRFKVPVSQEILDKYELDEVVYSGTIDKVVIDDDGNLWGVDYKSAKVIQTLHYLVDPQVSAYMWALPHIYDKPIKGFLYQQHKKAVPNPGRTLKNGTISVAQNQATTHYMYRQTLIERYGSIDNTPQENVDYLNNLAMREDNLYDDFIRIDKIYRNERSAQSEGTKILMEMEDMLNPDLPLYPNPTRDCASFCPFYSPCISIDDGGNFQQELDVLMKPRDSVYDSWRKKIKWPKDTGEDFDFDKDI